MFLFNESLPYAVDAVADVDDPSDEGMALVCWLCEDYCLGGYVTKALERAAGQGKLKLMEYLAVHDSRGIWTDACANAAVRGGHLSVLEWFLSREVLSNDRINTPLADASGGGHTEVVEWLLARGSMWFTEALKNAIAFGHITIAKKLVEHFGTDAMSRVLAMRVAAANNRVEVLEWLHEVAPEPLGSDSVMEAAAASGRMEALVWLHNNRSDGCSTSAMDGAAANGHLEVVKWLHANRQEGCSTNAMDGAAGGGSLEVVKWLHANHTVGCTAQAVDLAVSNGHLEITQWLHANMDRGCTANAPVLAAKGGHLEVLMWLHATIIGLECSTSVIVAATTLRYSSGCTPTASRVHDAAVNLAIVDSDFDRLLFLEKHYPSIECSDDASISALTRGHVETYFWVGWTDPSRIDVDCDLRTESFI